MKKIQLFTSLLMLSALAFSQSEAEKIFQKYFSDYIENYSPESGNIPTDSTIEDFRDQYKLLTDAQEDIGVYLYSEGSLKIFKAEDLMDFEKVSDIDSLDIFFKKESNKLKRYLGEHYEYGFNEEYCLKLYKDNKSLLKAKDLNSAIKIWRELFYYFPKYKYHYSKGDVLMRQKIKMLQDSVRKYDLLICEAVNKKKLCDSVKIYSKQFEDLMKEKGKYIDTLLMIYDQRIKYLGDAKTYGKGYLLGKKGSYIYQYRKDCCLEESYAILKESIDIEQENTLYNIVKVFYDASKELFIDGKIHKINHLDDYNICLKILSESTDKYQNLIDEEIVKFSPNQQKLKNWNKVILNNNKVYEYIQRSFYSGVGSPKCEFLIPAFEKEFEKRKTDKEWLLRVFEILTYKGCTEDSFYYQISYELSKSKYSPDSAYSKCINSMKDESFDEAAVKIKLAFVTESDSSKKALYLYTFAVIEFARNDYPKSRKYALKATTYRKNYGKPYILIAKLYSASGDQCGNDEFEKRAVYWAAVDKLEYAKSIDPTCEEEANMLIEKYTTRFPNASDGFTPHNYDGQDYKVGCWIQEMTKTRFLTD